VIIVLGIAYSYVRQFSYSLVASATCGGVFAILVVTSSQYGFLASETGFAIAFSPRDVSDPGMFYTLLTSMYAHADPSHLIFNLLVLAFIGMIFEQRIGTRPFIILYLLCGLAGTLLFTAIRWNDLVLVVGASGAISGVLGAFARLYPHERMTFVFFPLFPIPLWVVVAGFLVLQLFFLSGQSNVAVEAHIGGLAAGLLLAPLVVKMPVRSRVRRMVSLSALRRMATTPELEAILRNIEDEEFPDVRSAWIEEFLSTAKCPQCGARLRVTREAVMCERGHML
jgi:membrane associated rhomboid family serine protease